MAKSTYAEVGKVFMEKRQQAGFSSREGELEEALGIAKSAIAMIEEGKRLPTREEVSLMAEVYHAPELVDYYCTHVCELGRHRKQWEEVDQVYSYHTFLYPFVWDDGGKTTRDEFEQNLRGDWVEDNMITADNQLSSVVARQQWTDDAQQRWDYQTFQYFNSAARKALFRSNGNIVHGWLYKPAEIHNKGKYIIEAKEKEDGLYVNKRHTLNINHIKLHLFNTGVGILRFELEYKIRIPQEKNAEEIDQECKEYIQQLRQKCIEQARKDIRAINEYGRRIYPAFLPSTKNESEDGSFLKSNLCAASIELDFGDGNSLFEHIQERANAHLDSESEASSYLHNPMQNDNFVNKLLLGNSNKIKIVPAVDDRMFVCCCIVDSEYANLFLGYEAWPADKNAAHRQATNWKFKTDWETGKELYALINIDADAASCQNRRMLDKYFEEQLYLRWLEMGTIHAVTNHSMFCITSPDVQDSVINPFLIEYVPMCELVLVQRASLISFDSKITEVIAPSYYRESMSKKELEELISLQKEFTIFQGELLLAEITPQIQGIELYEYLQRMLFIQKLHDNILDRMKNLFELAEAEQAARQEKVERAFMVIAILAVGSAWQALYSFIGEILPENIHISCIDKTVPWLWLAIVILVTGWVIFEFRKVIADRWNGRKRKRADKK